MADQPKRAGCHLSALRQCHCIGRAAGPNCRFWSEDLDGDIARGNERTAAELVIPPLDADIGRLMAMPEAEVDAELRSMGMDPADAERRGRNAVQKALAIFHITRAEANLQPGALEFVRGHLNAAREALRSKPSGVLGTHETEPKGGA